MLNMFRMLIHPSSGACDLFVELFHGVYCSGTMCVGVTLWYGWGGLVSVCSSASASRKLLRMDVLTFETCWALNNEIIKQVTSSWSLFIQLESGVFVAVTWVVVLILMHRINNVNKFDILLTVHLSIFISVINQLDAQNFCFTISLFHASTCFEHMCSSSGRQNCIIQPLVSSYPLVAVRCTGWESPLSTCAPDGGLHFQPVHRTATNGYDDTRGCIIQFWRPDDEHMCSKHVEKYKKLIIKQEFVHQVG